ncbi:hypothetical protein ROZALSC1DRAFT_30258 [Rozella allomycis CSF55]|uniref:Uncharacterized protein n=1 Tax=Rozella allomycis (strain CSF55) TaxID=988480 RepID=A0A075AYE0_ROZAC|nr:hypothetical protein O9G_000344 [Rozella allomycis CSF55]RKP17996.1 hypothetical protein ROZALSC1DRAFT_30258 [Rozella allomycis CSF55]|eukprot:EPZ33569.1 hypothetical protein O9G_000344 [Rozella allomycis CSF55]
MTSSLPVIILLKICLLCNGIQSISNITPLKFNDTSKSAVIMLHPKSYDFCKIAYQESQKLTRLRNLKTYQAVDKLQNHLTVLKLRSSHNRYLKLFYDFIFLLKCPLMEELYDIGSIMIRRFSSIRRSWDSVALMRNIVKLVFLARTSNFLVPSPQLEYTVLDLMKSSEVLLDDVATGIEMLLRSESIKMLPKSETGDVKSEIYDFRNDDVTLKVLMSVSWIIALLSLWLSFSLYFLNRKLKKNSVCHYVSTFEKCSNKDGGFEDPRSVSELSTPIVLM